MTWKGIIAFVVMIAMVPSPLYAITDSSTVTMEITGGDTTAPSVPTNLNATAVAATQIDLTWTASTDDTAVTGYQVFRDSVQIATSTGTSYSDTDLSANTTYTYTVTAFDAALNISAASNSASVTTLAVSAGSGSQPVQLIGISVTPFSNSALVEWETDPSSRGTLLWGKTSDYELGSVQERAFDTDHAILITGLEAGTTYYYTIHAEDGRTDSTHVLIRGTFRTTAAPDTTAPANVSGLFAGIDGDDIVLSWVNPTDPDFSHVRVIRNNTFFPVDPNDGWLVYEGDDTLIRDVDIVPDGGVKYYSVFSYDRNGNVSSGAVVRVVIDPDAVIDRDVPEDIEQVLQFSDLIFRHGTIELPNDGEQAKIFADQQLTIAIPYDLLLEHLKTITVTLTDPEFPERTFTFLLRSNEDRTEYQTTLSSLQKAGVYNVEVSVFDFNFDTLTKVHGELLARKAAIIEKSEGVLGVIGFISRELFNRSRLTLLLIVILLLIAYILIADERNKWRRHERHATGY